MGSLLHLDFLEWTLQHDHKLWTVLCLDNVTCFTLFIWTQQGSTKFWPLFITIFSGPPVYLNPWHECILVMFRVFPHVEALGVSFQVLSLDLASGFPPSKCQDWFDCLSSWKHCVSLLLLHCLFVLSPWRVYRLMWLTGCPHLQSQAVL